MKVAGIALFLVAIPLAAQTSVVGSEALNGSFDDLYEAAPECQNTVLQYTTFGPTSKQAAESFKQCEQQLQDWNAKTKTSIPGVPAGLAKQTSASADQANPKPSVPIAPPPVPAEPGRGASVLADVATTRASVPVATPRAQAEPDEEGPAPADQANPKASAPNAQARVQAEPDEEESAPADQANARGSAPNAPLPVPGGLGRFGAGREREPAPVAVDQVSAQPSVPQLNAQPSTPSVPPRVPAELGKASPAPANAANTQSSIPAAQPAANKQLKLVNVEFQLLVLAMEADICLRSFSSH